METYSALRQFADSWWLLVMFVFFLAVVVWTFRPGSRKTHQDIAEIPLRDDDPDRLKDDDEAADRASRPRDEDDASDGGETGDRDENEPPRKGRNGGEGRHERSAPKEI